METKRFRNFISGMNELNSHQFRLLEENVKAHVLKNKVEANLETRYDKLFCPHCKSSEKVRWGKRQGIQRYKCKACKKTYNSLSGTPLARLRKKELWLEYASCLVNGVSIRKAAALCSVHKSTSFRWRHRFLYNAKTILPKVLNGIVEAEETYFQKSEKGNKNLNRKARKRGGQAGRGKEKVCVLICRDRYKNTMDKIFETFRSDKLKQELTPRIDKDALFCSDGKPVYKRFVKESNYRHGCLNLSKGLDVIKEIVHIRNVTNYHSRLRQWLHRFHGVATKYLDNYLSWFRELDEFSTEIEPEVLLHRAKVPGKYKTQPLTIT